MISPSRTIGTGRASADETVTINDVDFSTWLDLEGSGEFDAFMLSWIGNIDPDDFYYAQHHSAGGFNFQFYSNTEVDQLLDDARVETDQAARKALYDQAAKIIVDEASYIYLYNPDNINAWRDEVGGYATRGDNAFNDAMTYYMIDTNQRYMQSLSFVGAIAIQDGPIGTDTDDGEVDEVK